MDIIGEDWEKSLREEKHRLERIEKEYGYSQNYRLQDEDLKHIKKYNNYSTTFEKCTYAHGKMYEYKSEIPYQGLVVEVIDSGFGCGRRDSYVVLSVKKNKNNQVKEAVVALVIKYEEKNLEYLDNRRKILVQSGDKCGTWKWKDDKASYSYFVNWGDINERDIGFDN